MSFSIECSSCGAPSTPSVGVCPYCKSVFNAEQSETKCPTLKNLKTIYDTGDLPKALSLAQAIYEKKEKLRKNCNFLLIYAKILIESEGPSSKIRSILQEAHLEDMENLEIANYLEIIEAKSNLSHEKNDVGEILLKDLLRREPKNPHALFLLGTHLFWVEKNVNQALIYMERCVRVHQNFLRAWACLGMIYKEIGNLTLASRAFQKCVKLETRPEMKNFFQEHVAA